MGKVIGLGDVFKSARTKKGLSLTDIERETKIRSKYIEAIENENFEVIPGKVYLKGFIKTYAKYLNIEDAEEIVGFLEDNKTPAFEIEKIEEFQPKTKMPRSLPKKYITLLLGVVAILVLIGVHNLYENNFKPHIDPPPPAPPMPPVIQEPQEPQPVEPELPQKMQLVIEVLDINTTKEACWVQVYADNSLAYEGTMYEGDKKTIEAEEKIKIKLGNAGVVKLLLGKNDFGIPGKVNQIFTREFTRSDFQ